MAIKRIGGVAGPAGSIPTARGWVHPRTGELLKSQRITQEQLDEWNGTQILAEPVIYDVEPTIDLNNVVDEDYDEGEVYAEDIEDEVQEVQKPKKKTKAKKKKFGLFG